MGYSNLGKVLCLFKCDRCGKFRAKPNKVFVATRPRVYINDKGKKSKGWEIVKEVHVCNSCVDE